MLHLKNVNIEKFANLTNLKIDRLEQFNLLIGKNNVGKTNFLKYVESERKGSRCDGESEYINFESKVLARLSAFGITEKMTHYNENIQAVILDAAKMFVPDASELHYVVDGKYHSLEIWQHTGLKAVSVEILGNGAKRVVGFGLALARSAKGVLLIDEVENGLLWTILPEVWNFLIRSAKRLEVQMFATTHSLDCIRAFNEALEETEEKSALVIRLEQRDTGTHAEIFDVDRLAVVLKERIEIR
jgi:AAA15 family ATPase/GTPase